MTKKEKMMDVSCYERLMHHSTASCDLLRQGPVGHGLIDDHKGGAQVLPLVSRLSDNPRPNESIV